MADKARMSAYGTLGAYLMGHSPVDRALLRRLGLTTAEFTQMVAANPDDASLLAALRAHGFDEDRVRRWSANFTTTYAAYIPLWDLDEGYRAPGPLLAPFMGVMKVVEGPLMAMFRKISPAP